jgi:plastocyanin
MRKSLIAAGLLLAAIAPCVWAADADVTQKGQRFSQTSINLGVGDTMHFHNEDDVTHNINIIDSDGVPDDQGLQKPGEVINHKFDKVGTFEARCAIHPRMKMTIAVK